MRYACYEIGSFVVTQRCRHAKSAARDSRRNFEACSDDAASYAQCRSVHVSCVSPRGGADVRMVRGTDRGQGTRTETDVVLGGAASAPGSNRAQRPPVWLLFTWWRGLSMYAQRWLIANTLNGSTHSTSSLGNSTPAPSTTAIWWRSPGRCKRFSTLTNAADGDQFMRKGLAESPHFASSSAVRARSRRLVMSRADRGRIRGCAQRPHLA